jgi:hypothetical protein
VETDVVDYRKDKHSPMKAIKLPDEIEAQCLEIARALGLVLTGIDIRRTNDGEYVFLEANPSPVFTYFEDRTEGIDVSGALVDLLIAGKKKADNLHPFETYQTSFRNLEMVHI